MSSKFPDNIDVFETKYNATSQEDPNGDYVMAEHINDLQDAITAIEKTLGTNPESSSLTVSDRIAKAEVTSAFRVPSLLVYLGKPGYINGSKSLDEAVGHYVKHDQVVLGGNSEEINNINHNDAIYVIRETKKNRNVKFYGYIDCGINGRTLAEVQVKINQWRSMGIDGIYCDNFGYSSNINREQQNLILDSIHQYGLSAFLYASNPDDVLSDVGNPNHNPGWIAPNIQAGDVFHFRNFAVNTSATGYVQTATLLETINKLLGFRKALGVGIYATATIADGSNKGQEYFDFGHALSVLYSIDAFGSAVDNFGAITNTTHFYDWTPIIGAWYKSDPIVQTSDNITYVREVAFGKISVNMTDHTFEYKGISIPSFLLRMISNSVNGEFIKDATIEDKKIKAYDPNRIVNYINNSATALIDLDNIKGLMGGGGGISEDVLQANILKAINAQIGLLNADTAAIGSLTAGEISTGKLTAERISASVVAAINLYAATIEAGDAKISNAVIGELSVDNMKANVIQAVNISTTNISAEKLKATVVEAINISSTDIAAERMRANVVSAINLYADSMTIGSAKINAASIGELVATNIRAGFIDSDMIAAKAIKADKIDANAVTADAIKAGSITTNKIATEGLDATVIKSGFIDADRIKARSINADKIVARSITTTEIAAGTITADNIKAGAISSDKIQAGSITSEKISTDGLDAQLINVYNGKTGETLIGAGFLRVDGLDVGVVQSDNLIMNGLFLTASSSYGFRRDNQAGEVIIGSMSSTPGGHQVWKIDTQTGTLLNSLDVPGKKPFSIALDAGEKFAYVTVQGDNTVVQVDLENYVVTDKMLKSDQGPGKIYYSGKTLKDHKHMLVLGTDQDDQNIPDALMVVDGPPTSVNTALYMHHHIPLGNNPYDIIIDSSHTAYITMADEGHILVLSLHDRDSTSWKVSGRIPIAAYSTDNYHGGLPGEYGLNAAVGGSAAISYQDEVAAGNHSHHHGGYGAADGSLKKYEPHGIAQSSDSDTLYVVDFKNNELVIVDKYGNAPYNTMTGTREQGNFGELGYVDLELVYGQNPTPTDPGSGSGGGHDGHMMMAMDMGDGDMSHDLPPTLGPTPETTSGLRDYTNTNGETRYVRYRIPIGNAPEFVRVHNGKIYVTLSGAGRVAVIDENVITDRIAIDREYYKVWNEFFPFNEQANFEVRYIDVGSRPEEMEIDRTNNLLYVILNGQNQIAVVDMETEVIQQYINVGANPKGLTLSEDGTTLYVVNHGGAGNLSFVYKEGPYIGDAYLGLEGEVNHHGAMGWMADRSDWTHDTEGQVRSNSTVEFRINEPFLNEGGYVKISAVGDENQWAVIEQDIMNVTNFSDGLNPEGTSFKHHNGSALISLSEGNSPNFITTFEIDEMVPKYVSYDNQQTQKFTPSEDGINEEYQGLEYSGITNRAANRIPSSSADPVTGTLDIITNGILEEADLVTLPSGIQHVTIDLGRVYMVPKVHVIHKYHSMRTYKDTKTEVSEDGITWVTIWDSYVDGEYPEMTMEEMDHGDGSHMMMEHGKTFTFPALPVRYVRDTCGGWTETMDGMTMTGDSPTWSEIEVYGDWEVEYGHVYPPHTEKAGEPLPSNGRCFVSTDISDAFIALDIAIEFSSWSWMTFIAGPEYGTMAVEMPSIMASDHFVDQSWTYVTNISHKHTMILSPSANVKADESKGIKEGMHRLILKQSRGKITFDRSRFDDFQFLTKSSTLVTTSNSSSFRRHKIICEQAKSYQGIGLQTTEGPYNEVRKSPDTGLPDKSVAIKYRFRVRCELNAFGGVEERGIAYVTSCIMETGKLSTHWRMSSSSDLFPGTRIETWDASQPHKTGIRNEHIANGAIRGSKIMPNSLMDHHVSPYARISEFKLDLKWPTHGHGWWVEDMSLPSGMRFISNKATLDSITGWGASGVSTQMARADHVHQDLLQVEGVPDNGMVPVFLNDIISWTKQTHVVADITDLEAKYYDKNAVDILIATSNGGGTGGGGDVYQAQANIFTKMNTFVNTGTGIRFQPISEIPSDTVLFEILNRSGARQMGIEYSGRITATKVILGSQATGASDAVRADRQIRSGTGLTGGSALTSDVTLSVNFGGDGTANTAARSDHSHSGYISSILTNQTVQNNFTINGAMWIGTPSANGSLILRQNGINTIQFDASSTGKLSTVKSYIGIGTAQFEGNVRMGSLTIDTRDMITNLNAEMISGVQERELTKNISIRDQSGFGVFSGMEVEARPIPDMSVVVKAGVVYTSSGRRVAIPESTVALQSSSQNFDRIDVVYVQGASAGGNEGRVSVVVGTPTATPVKPNIPVDGIEIAKILVRSNIGSITDGFNRGAGTPDGSFDAIDDIRVWRPIIWNGTNLSIKGDIKEKDVRLEDKYAQKAVDNIFLGNSTYSSTTGADTFTLRVDSKSITMNKDLSLKSTSGKVSINSSVSVENNGYLRASKNAAKLVIPAGQTFVTWNHNHVGEDMNYIVNAMSNSASRHIHYKNQTATSIDICIEQAYSKDIEVMCSIIGY